MKTYLPFILFFLLTTLSAQHFPASFMEDESSLKKSSNPTFAEMVKKGEVFFASKDINKKGSGYKPFKRWEYHWKNYLQPDGTIAPAEHLWKAWEQKQQMAVSTKAVSNWAEKGPFDQSSKSGQGRINTVVVDPNNANIIYSGAPAGGLWKSTDAGVNWTPLTDNLPQIGVSGIAIDPNNSNIIYISTGDDDAGNSYSIGVLKSIDGGATFNQTGTISTTSISSNEIVIDPSNSNRVWVATDEGLYLSTDAGTTWIRKRSGHVRDFKLKPGDSNTIYAVTANAFFISTNGGDSFSTSTGLPSFSRVGRYRVEVTPASPNNVYVLAAETDASFEGIYLSTDSGENFSRITPDKLLADDSPNPNFVDIFGGSSQAFYDLAFSVSNTDPNTMFVGVLDIWRSTDGGNNFSQINEWFTVNAAFTHADIHFMRYYGNKLYVGSDGGTYVSDNNGDTFTDLTKDMSISQFYKITVSKQNSAKIAGGLQDNGGFAFSNNIWHNYHGGDGMDAASDPNDENTFYGFQQLGGALSVTTDGGLTSNQFFVSGPSQGNWVTPLVINKSSELYAGYGELYRLDNNTVFTQVSNHGFGGNLEAIEIDPNNNDNIFVSRGTTLYKSTNRGKTFTTLTSTVVTGVQISSIEVHNSDSNIVWLTTTGATNQTNFFGSGDTGGGVYKSIDGGLTFTDISSGLPDESKFIVRHHPFTTNNSIYVGTALGVYHRNDDDDIWEVFSTNLPNVAVTDLEINPFDNTITAATYGRSVWQSPIPTITQPTVDVDLLGITSPNNSVTCGDFNPSITVLNNGLNTLTSFTVNYDLDGGTNQVYNWTGNLASNASTTISLGEISGTSEGNHTLNAALVKTNDANSLNNSSSTSFVVNQNGNGQITYTFGDPNPEANENDGEWIVSDDNLWEIDTPTTPQLNNVVASGYVTNPSGNTPDQTTSLLYSPCYNLAILQNPVLKFKMAFALEQDFDIMYVEYSIDQGSTWQILGNASDPNWYNSNLTNASSGTANTCQNCPGSQWTGTDATLKEYSYNLSALNSESNIVFRFKFVADPNTNDEGIVIDDFVIDASAVLSVNDFEDGEFLIYPNPSTDIFNIRRNNTIGENMNVEVYDVTGKLIRKKTNIIDANYELNMEDVSKGIYFLQVSIDNKRLVKKIVLN